MNNFEKQSQDNQFIKNLPKGEVVSESKSAPETNPTITGEDILNKENIDLIMEQLDNDAVFTKVADKFLETIDDTLIMKGVRDLWDAIPEKGQDMFLATRHAPSPIINMYPWITKLMTDMGVLERKGSNVEEKIRKGLENDALVDRYIEMVSKVIPGGEVATPIVEKIVEAKSVLRDWMIKRRKKLLAIRHAKEVAVTESKAVDNLREQIDF